MKKMSYKFFLITSSLTVIITLFLGSIMMAYFSDYESKINSTIIHNIDTEIAEEVDDGPIVAGQQFKKCVTVKNVDLLDCYVRVRILVSPEKYYSDLNFDIDTENWILKDDGFYYYRYALESGQQTTPIFTGLTIPSYLETNDSFDISIYNESVQSVIYTTDGNVIQDLEKIWEIYDDK